MEIVNEIMACKDLVEAKLIAHQAVIDSPRAREENKVKAKRMIDSSTTIFKLGDNIVRGFILAHMGLKAIR